MSQTPSLAQLQPADAFLRRHLGPDPAEQQAMLDFLGVSTRAELIVQTVPPAIRLNRPLELPAALDEQAALARLRGYAGLNQRWTSLIGMGYYGTVTPPVILRNVLENPGWYTAYTPYQPEIAQGRLEALLNFQQLTIDLTGLDLASASLLDEATAAAEAMALARRVAKARSNRFFVDAHCHPQTVSVLRTRAEAFGFELVVDEPDNLAAHAVFERLAAIPGQSRRDPRPAPAYRGVARSTGAGLRRQRPARPVGADPAGGTRCRRGARQRPALWRTDGLRRTARGVLRHPRRVQAGNAGADHRRFP